MKIGFHSVLLGLASCISIQQSVIASPPPSSQQSVSTESAEALKQQIFNCFSQTRKTTSFDFTEKLTALFLALSCFPAFAEQTVDIEVQGIRGFRAVRNTDLNVHLINKEEMDGSERYQHLVTQAVDRGLRVFWLL